jgi:hypothetical protein
MTTRLLLSIFILLFINKHTPFAQELKSLYQKSITAYNNKDYQKFKDLNNQALQLHPSYPALLYNQVSAFALNNEKENAAIALMKLLTWNSNIKFEEETDFALLMKDEKLKQLILNQSAHYSKSKQESTIYSIIPENLHLEDVLYLNDNLIMTDVYHGQVIVYNIEQKHISGKVQLNGSGLAVANSEDVNCVWATSSMMANYHNYHQELENQTFLYKINIETNNIVESIELDANAVLGSIISNNGFLYATNSIEPEVYVIDSEKNKIIDIWKIDGAYNLQGLTIQNDFIYVADYIRGIVKIERRNGNVVDWLNSSDYLLKGIDGLNSIDQNTLIAIQNNSTPNRVVKISHDGHTVQKVELLDNGIFASGEPTNGYYDKNIGFIFIANSPWQYYDKENKPLLTEWKAQEIRVLKLK